MIVLNRVSKHYADGTVAVDELSLELPSKSITVFVGPSGCGKTTSLRMINRMIEPSSGRILIDGQDTRQRRPAELRRNIGYVLQQAGLFPNKTVLENVMTVPLLHGETKSVARNRAKELLEVVGLGSAFDGRYPAQLSGGQQQRVGVARALAANPPVLLMDEPFSAVDPVVRTQLQDELLHIQAQLAKTVVFVTHDIDEAIKLGDRVAVLAPGGRLAQIAPPAELLAHPASQFVSDFIGRDRGYRALGFRAAGDVVIDQEPVVTLGHRAPEEQWSGRDGWSLVVDSVSRPVGWVATDALAHASDLTSSSLDSSGSLVTERNSLREFLGAALSSPSGRGVVVSEQGTYVGTVTVSAILTAHRRGAQNSDRAA